VAVYGATGARIIVPPRNDVVCSHHRLASQPQGQTGAKSDHSVVIACLLSPRCNQMASVEAH
jgi:hypothetical protein